jgi:hypothetical protein
MGLPIQRPAQGLRKSNVVSFTPGAPATNATLQGWKEIAGELDRSVRTVQRWEQKFGLPVHKLGDGVGSPVFAFKDELHSWLRANASERKQTNPEISKSTSLNQNEENLERRRAELGKGRNSSESRTTPSEPEIIKSLNAFFALKAANNTTPSCNRCHTSTRLLIGQFWLYGTDRTWQVSVPFCPGCDSDLHAMLPPSSQSLTQ